MRLSELAKALSLPLTTVRRVLSGQAEAHGIPVETADRVLEEARARGFVAAEADAAAPPAGADAGLTPTIGVIVTDLSNPFFGNVTAALEQTAREAGFVTLIGVSGESLEREHALVHELRARGADGLVIAAAGPDHEHLRELQDEGYPFVLLDRVFEELDCDWVVVENQLASCRLCDALLARGARRIAFLGGQVAAYTGRERLEGYRAALRRQRIPFDNGLVFRGEFSEASGQAAAEWLLELPAPPEAVFCANNRILTGCLNRLASAPPDPWARLPFACFDEVPFMQHLGRPLVVAAQPERGIGKRAAELLIARLQSGGPGADRMGKPYHQEMLEVEQKFFGF